MNNIKKATIIKSLFVIVIILALILSFNFYSVDEDHLLNIHMIDVGQGDSILITTPNNKTILIDAGDATQGPKVVSYLKKKRIKTVDMLIATHPHSDHIGGIPSVLENFKVESFFMPPVSHTSKAFENMLLALNDQGLKASSLPLGRKIEFDDDINLYFLSPNKNYGENLNLWSIVLKLDYKERSFLFTGDLEYEAELEILKTYEPEFLKSHLLKVGHHGSNSSSTEVFLTTIRPHIALISCGTNNSYNHPHAEVIDRLNKRGIHIYRTDYQGTVVFKSDGKEIWSHKKPYDL